MDEGWSRFQTQLKNETASKTDFMFDLLVQEIHEFDNYLLLDTQHNMEIKGNKIAC